MNKNLVFETEGKIGETEETGHIFRFRLSASVETVYGALNKSPGLKGMFQMFVAEDCFADLY